jgi:hypothetical protein
MSHTGGKTRYFVNVHVDFLQYGSLFEPHWSLMSHIGAYRMFRSALPTKDRFGPNPDLACGAVTVPFAPIVTHLRSQAGVAWCQS